MNLTEQQRAAIESNEPSILVLASPGSGKTATLVARIRRLIAEGVDPQTICAIAYTISSAAEIQSRLGDERLSYTGTLHGWLAGILRDAGRRITVLSERDTEELIRETISDTRYRGTRKALDWVLKQGPQHFERGSGRKNGPPEETAFTIWSRMSDGNLMSYDALLYAGFLHVRNNPMKLSHLLVDELQDASAIDYAIYRNIIAGNYFMVGDSDQAIFGFRGADVRGMQRLAKRFTVLKLESCFRCAPKICEAANNLIEHNADRLPKVLIPTRAEPGSVTTCFFASDIIETREVVNHVADLVFGQVKEPTPHEPLLTKPSVAILCRTNFEVGQWADALTNEGISVARKKLPGEGLPEGWEKLRATLDFFASPESDYLAKRFLLTLSPKIEHYVTTAARAGKSINQACIGFPNSPATHPEALRGFLDDKSAIPLKTIDWLCEKLKEMPSGISMADISMMLADIENRGQDQFDETADCFVMTIHSAKSKEFSHVICPGWNEGLFPRGNDDLPEARRCAFVAITRAKDSILITGSEQRRTRFDGVKSFEKSRFANEIAHYKNPSVV